MHFYPIPCSSVRHVTSRDVRDQSRVGYVTLQNNTITSLIHSVTSSSPRPALLGCRSSSLLFDFLAPYFNMFVFFKLHFLKILGVYTQFSGPATSNSLSPCLSWTPVVTPFFFRRFDHLFSCLLQVEPKGLTTGYKVHDWPGLTCYYSHTISLLSKAFKVSLTYIWLCFCGIRSEPKLFLCQNTMFI